MAARKWRPLGMREGKAAQEYDALHEGVPPWLFPSLWDWISTHLFQQDGLGGWEVIEELRLQMERQLRQPLHRRVRELREQLLQDTRLCLRVVDFLLLDGGANREDLRSQLDEAGSAWDVSPDGESLCRRVPETVRALFVQASGDNVASELLRTAWNKVYGMSPDPKAAFDECIRAVEAVAIPATCPTDKKATLGSVIRDLRDNTASYSFSIDTPKVPAQPIEVVRGMCELLWNGQTHRHSTGEAPTQKESEAALHVAGTLVLWFSKGHVTRKT